jgi:hypothetical protein
MEKTMVKGGSKSSGSRIPRKEIKVTDTICALET